MIISILISSILTAAASAQCSRETLTNITDTYIRAQTSGSLTTFTQNLISNITYTENEKPLNIMTGILSQPLKIDHTRSIHDEILCGTFTETIITNPEHPYVIGTRMLVNDKKVTLMESIVTKPGDWAFNATGYLRWTSLENWDPIPLSRQDSRSTIQAAGDAYFNRFSNPNISVPFGTPCARLEGGAYTGTQNSTTETCSLGLPSNVTVTNRRYVIDQTMGTVSIFLGFPGLDHSQGMKAMPDGHLFRVEEGRIRFIHTVSSCVVRGCGVNVTGPPSPARVYRWPTLRRSLGTF